jgi:hypothetical protein
MIRGYSGPVRKYLLDVFEDHPDGVVKGVIEVEFCQRRNVLPLWVTGMIGRLYDEQVIEWVDDPPRIRLTGKKTNMKRAILLALAESGTTRWQNIHASTGYAEAHIVRAMESLEDEGKVKAKGDHELSLTAKGKREISKLRYANEKPPAVTVQEQLQETLDKTIMF